MSLNETRGWKTDVDEETQSVTVKSVDDVPIVQNPLGSSVMTPDET